MGVLEVLEFQFDPAPRADDRFAVGGGQDGFFLHHAPANVIEIAARVLFVHGI